MPEPGWCPQHRYVVEIASRYLSTGEVLSSTDVTVEQGESTQMEPMSESESEDNGPGRVFHICGTVEQDRAEKLRSTFFASQARLRSMFCDRSAPIGIVMGSGVTNSRVWSGSSRCSPTMLKLQLSFCTFFV